MYRTLIRMTVVLMLAALACGCKKTAEGETKKWTANKAALQKLSSKCENLSEVIDEHLKKTQKKFNKAKKLDGDKKIKAMAAANSAARKVISPFESYDRAVRETSTLIKDKQIGKLPSDRVKSAVKACKKAKKKAKKLLADAAVEDVDELIAKAESAGSKVRAGMSKLKTLKREADRKKKKKKKKKKKE